jgi:AcrR family transcriptional regulator
LIGSSKVLEASLVKESRVQDESAVGSRQARRKARTRQALLDAAVQLTVEGRAGQATIQEITDTADLGFGSFYNHFEAKEELFHEATAQVMERWSVMLDRAVENIDDPAEIFAASFRLSCGLAHGNPDLARFLTEVGLGALAHQDGLAPRALHDIRRAQAAGRFGDLDAELGLAAAAGALIGFLARELERSPRPDDESREELTAGMLRLLGLDETDARTVATRPLPPLDGRM